MTGGKLPACLEDGLLPVRWYAMLDARVFSWLDRARINRLPGAHAHRRRAHLVITLDTAGLLAGHTARVRLPPVGSGSTPFKPSKRGRAPFRRIADHPAPTPVIELAMEGGAPDIAAYVVRLNRRSDGVARAVAGWTPALDPAP